MNALHRTWDKLIQAELDSYRKKGYPDVWRPRLHLSPPVGWLNDPNGLCQYRGEYHAFYQLSPFEPEGGLKFWGHCTSSDLLHWEFQGVPLMPDQPYDCHGAYSGSALVEEDGLYAFFTGNVKLAGDYDYISNGRESNTILAVSRDGRSFETKTLLMTSDDYPSDLTRHVRDPKVWQENGTYYMVQGARTKEDVGVVLLFESKDKMHWTYKTRLQSAEPFGYMWECPDLYEVDGRRVLSISPQGVEQEGLRYANMYQSVTCFLDGDFREGPVCGGFRELDGGFDFYAPQTFRAEDGRRIQIGWMGMPDVADQYTNKTIADGWQNVLTLPRELFVKNGILCQRPVRELDSWWNQELALEGTYEGSIDPCCEIALAVDDGDVSLTLGGGLVLRYDSSEQVFWMEFTDSSLGAGRRVRGRKLEQLTDLRVVVDVSCVEVYLNGGEDVFSTRFYPEKSQYRLKLEGAKARGRLLWHK